MFDVGALAGMAAAEQAAAEVAVRTAAHVAVALAWNHLDDL